MPHEWISPVLTLKKINSWWSWVTSRLVFGIKKVFSCRINIYCPPRRLWQCEVFLSDHIVFEIIWIIEACPARNSLMLSWIIHKRVTWKHYIQVLSNWLVLVVWVVQIIWRQTIWILVFLFAFFILERRLIWLNGIVGLEDRL